MEFWENGINYADRRRTFFNQQVADQLERNFENDQSEYDDENDWLDGASHGGPLLDPEVVDKPAS